MTEVPLDALKKVAKTADATINDAFLGVAGGPRRPVVFSVSWGDTSALRAVFYYGVGPGNSSGAA